MRVPVQALRWMIKPLARVFLGKGKPENAVDQRGVFPCLRPGPLTL